MKFNSKLWMLAVAMATVGCQDDLVDGGGTGTTTPEDGEGVYLTVNIASPTGTATKATPTGGEDGDNQFLEGSEEERAIHDLNIYLVAANKTSVTSAITSKADGVTVASTAMTNGEPKIEGHGYTTEIGGSTASGVAHHTANSVKIAVDPASLTATGVTYHVFAVANLGSSISFSDLGALRDAINATAESGWNGSAWAGSSNKYGEASNFVMSTHQMYDTGGASSVQISTANTDPDTPASTTVYIERLAARIDMNLVSSLTDGTGTVTNPIEIEGSEKETKDLVQLTGYQIINQWKGNNYLLKRVTKDVTGVETDNYFPAMPNPLTDGVRYLGDETYDVSNHKYAYVIDPKTADKKAQADGTISSTIAGDYTSHYDATLNNNLTTAFSGVTGISTTAGTFTPILYTKENSLDRDNQIYGLMTGVMFQGKYTPSAVSTFTTTGGDAGTDVGVIAGTYTAGNDFYVIRDLTNKEGSYYLCNDLKTIGALSFAKIPEETGKTMNLATIMKVLFTDETSWGANANAVTLDNLKAAVAAMDGGVINIAYKEYLDKIVNPTGDGATAPTMDADLAAKVKWSAFLTSENINDPGDQDGTATESKTLYDDYNIAYYDGGVCYFPYWIQHANNGDDAFLGPMEYCIVRNNVYQLAVTGVKALGDPLPFLDPENTPGESKQVYLSVQIYVKNWVVRKNEGIIL